VFTLRIIQTTQTQYADVKAAGTYSFHSAIKGLKENKIIGTGICGDNWHESQRNMKSQAVYLGKRWFTKFCIG
jgi:hypothetical protein